MWQQQVSLFSKMKGTNMSVRQNDYDKRFLIHMAKGNEFVIRQSTALLPINQKMSNIQSIDLFLDRNLIS